MTPVAWLLVVVAMGVGLGAGLWSARSGGRSRATSNTLVPARTRQVLSVMPGGAVIVRRDRRSAYCNNAALALGVARPDGALHPELARLAEIAWNHNEIIEEDIEVQRGVLASSRTLQARVCVIDDETVLALIADPVAEAQRCGPRDRRRLRRVEPLLDRDHLAWTPLSDDDYRRGSSALEFLLDSP